MRTRSAFVLYALLDLACVAVGMGVPVCCIALGFPVGWLIAAKAVSKLNSIKDILQRVLVYSLITSALTFLIMVAIWGPPFLMVFDPDADLEHFGMPLLLYGAKASFIGWHVLMICFSPFLQLLTTIFAAYVALWLSFRRMAAISASSSSLSRGIISS